MDSKEERKRNLIKQGEEQNCPEKENEKQKGNVGERPKKARVFNVFKCVCVMSTS